MTVTIRSTEHCRVTVTIRGTEQCRVTVTLRSTVHYRVTVTIILLTSLGESDYIEHRLIKRDSDHKEQWHFRLTVTIMSNEHFRVKVSVQKMLYVY